MEKTMNATLHQNPPPALTRWLNLGPRLGTGLALLLVLLMTQTTVRAVDVLEDMYNPARTGENPDETILNTTNVNVNDFGKLWAYPVNGATYAQTLYVSGLHVAGATYNVVFIVTMEDQVYAFNADANQLLWHDNFTNGSNIVPFPVSDVTGNTNQNISGNAGIESTPYIDLNLGAMYLLARTKNTSNTTYYQTLHALNLTNGAEMFGGPVNISASGFQPERQNQRMGLAKAGNNIIITWTSHEDATPYHGWMMAYNETTLAQEGVFNDTPTGSQGGIWQQGRAPAVDASGNVYVITGNGTWDGSENFGESFLKLSGSLSLEDWFTPDNYATLNAGDEDLGSGGPMLIPGTSIVFGGGKQGVVFLCNTGDLGHEQSGNGQVLQSFQFASGEIHGGAVYYNNPVSGPGVYDMANGDNLKLYTFNGSTFDPTPHAVSSAAAAGAPGAFLTVSDDSSAPGSGIVWGSIETSDDDHGLVPGIVRAWNATDINGTELWDSSQNSSRDNPGTFVKDANPTVVNGKVYVGSYSGQVNVYGLLTGCSPTPITPYLQVNGGAWVPAANTNVAVGGTLALGPQPLTGGSWSWTGPDGFTSTSRQVTITDIQTAQAGTYTATYVNACGSPSYQYFDITVGGIGGGGPVADGTYQIDNLGSGLCLDVDGGGNAPGTLIDQYTYNGHGWQQWTLTYQSGGSYKIIGVASGDSLDIAGGGTGNGTSVDIQPYTGNSNQQFTLTPTSGGYYRITPGNATGSCVEVKGNSTTNSALVQIYTYSGTHGQQWKFVSE